jgi:hypothetical protein
VPVVKKVEKSAVSLQKTFASTGMNPVGGAQKSAKSFSSVLIPS